LIPQAATGLAPAEDEPRCHPCRSPTAGRVPNRRLAGTLRSMACDAGDLGAGL